jgi:hypothetical protein
MNNAIDVIPPSAAQAASYDKHRDDYQIYCTSLKHASRPGKLLAAAELFIPDFALHISCKLVRDDRGHQRLDLPRVKVEDPTGRIHHKTLMRWSTAEAERRFQRLGLAAIDDYQRNTATHRDPLPTRPRFAPLARANTSLAFSTSPPSNR